MSISSKFTYNTTLSNGATAFDTTLYDNVTSFSSVLVTCYSTTALTLSLSHSTDKATNSSIDIDTINANTLYSETFTIKNKFININLENNSDSTATVNLHVKYLTQLGEINSTISYPIINNFNSLLSLTDISSNGMDASGVAISRTATIDISSNIRFIIIKAVGGGGGGGHSYFSYNTTNTHGSGGGGGAGGYVELYLSYSDFKYYDRLSITVGKGGAQSTYTTSSASDGGTGGNTIISLTNTINLDIDTKNIATCFGGTGGIGGDNTSANGGFGGYGGSYTIDPTILGFGIVGNNGLPGWKSTSTIINVSGGVGGYSVLGTAGRGTNDVSSSYLFGDYGGGGGGSGYEGSTTSDPPHTVFSGGGGGGRCLIFMFD